MTTSWPPRRTIPMSSISMGSFDYGPCSASITGRAVLLSTDGGNNLERFNPGQQADSGQLPLTPTSTRWFINPNQPLPVLGGFRTVEWCVQTGGSRMSPTSATKPRSDRRRERLLQEPALASAENRWANVKQWFFNLCSSRVCQLAARIR